MPTLLLIPGTGSKLRGTAELATYLSSLIEPSANSASKQTNEDCRQYILSATALLSNQIWPQHATLDELNLKLRSLPRATEFHGNKKLYTPRLGRTSVEDALTDFFGHADLDGLADTLSGSR